MRLLLASLAVRVTVTLELEATVLLETLIVELLREIAAEVTVTEGLLLVIACELTVAPIEVAVPVLTPVKLSV
jgi:hypothetical protein